LDRKEVEMALPAVITEDLPNAFVSRRRLYSVDLASTTVAYPFAREKRSHGARTRSSSSKFRRDDPEPAAELTIAERELSVDGSR